MEPVTTLAILGGAVGSAQLVVKILGPTADYLGGEVRNYSEKGMSNLSRIFLHAAETLGSKVEEPGQVPPRVLKGILEEGYFCEDELSGMYFGGVLASSRSGVNRDDRANSFTALISRLSTYGIRAHFIFYSVFKSLCNGRSLELGHDRVRDRLKMHISSEEYSRAMDFQDGESPSVVTSHVMLGLHREVLIGPAYAGGSKELIKKFVGIDVESGGVAFSPSAAGLELYLWAHGRGDLVLDRFLSEQFPPIGLPGLELPTRARCYER